MGAETWGSPLQIHVLPPTLRLPSAWEVHPVDVSPGPWALWLLWGWAADRREMLSAVPPSSGCHSEPPTPGSSGSFSTKVGPGVVGRGPDSVRWVPLKKRIRSNRENASGSQSPQRGEMGQGELTTGQKGVLPAALLPQTVPTKSHLLQGRSGAAYPSVSPHSVWVPTRLPGAHALWRQTLLCSDREAPQFVFVILPQQQALPCFPNKTVPPLCPSRKKRSCLGSLQPCMVGRAPRRGAQVPKGTAAPDRRVSVGGGAVDPGF